MYLTTVRVLFIFLFFRDVPFFEYFCTINNAVLSLCGEFVVRFLLPDGVFLPYDNGLDFLQQLIM